MDAYWESILLEFRQYDHIMYVALRGAEVTYPDSAKILLTVEESVLTKSKEEEMLRILNKVFQERCGVDVVIKFDYREPVESRFAEEEEKKLSMEVAEIAARLRALNGRDDDGSGQQSAVQTATADEKMQMTQMVKMVQKRAGCRQVRQPENRKHCSPSRRRQRKRFGGSRKPECRRKRFFPEGRLQRQGRPLLRRRWQKGIRRSDNPDVVYGRDFDKEVTKIVDIIGEIGEVTIRGRVTSLEVRELKNNENPF